MKFLKTIGWTAFILALAAVIAGYLWSSGRTAISQHPMTNTLNRHRISQQDEVMTTRPLYGKTALSKEEKRILYKPFPEIRNAENISKAWMIAMICMKHRLTCAEVRELIASPPFGYGSDESGSSLSYLYGKEGVLQFSFDKNGKLEKVHGISELPPMESVSTDTPIEPPSLPAEQ